MHAARNTRPVYAGLRVTETRRVTAREHQISGWVAHAAHAAVCLRYVSHSRLASGCVQYLHVLVFVIVCAFAHSHILVFIKTPPSFIVPSFIHHQSH